MDWRGLAPLTQQEKICPDGGVARLAPPSGIVERAEVPTPHSSCFAHSVGSTECAERASGASWQPALAAELQQTRDTLFSDIFDAFGLYTRATSLW